MSVHLIYWNIRMDRLDLMEIVVAVVDTGSLSAAARKLDLPLPTVSRKVAALEQHLKTRLFTRTSRPIGITDAGKEYGLQCRRLLVEIREVERAAAGEYSEPKGELLISAPLVFGRFRPRRTHWRAPRQQSRGDPARSRLVVSTAEAAIDAAVAGVGITRVLSYQSAKAVAEGTLRLLLKAHDSSPRPVSFAYRAGRLLPQKLRAFVDFAIPCLRGSIEP